MKRGSSVRLRRKPHELVVAGSNPALASTYEEPLRNIILAVHRHKNQDLNVERTAVISGSFLKRASNLGVHASSQLKTIYHRLTAVILCMFECCVWRGVDVYS